MTRIIRFHAASSSAWRARLTSESTSSWFGRPCCLKAPRRIIAEADRPRCDVFWNNEIAHTVSLAGDGLLASYASPSAEGIPAEFRDPQDRWTGFAARARVFIVNTELADPAPAIAATPGTEA